MVNIKFADARAEWQIRALSDKDQLVDESNIAQNLGLGKNIASGQGFVFGRDRVRRAARADDVVVQARRIALAHRSFGLTAQNQIPDEGIMPSKKMADHPF